MSKAQRGSKPDLVPRCPAFSLRLGPDKQVSTPKQRAGLFDLLDQLRAHFDWLDQMLADGRSFLQGPAAGLADLAAYHPVWFLRQNFGSAAVPLDGFPPRAALSSRALSP